ncbi:WecB/TagA/CpsF family glycosyltransferase (plasmid) [Coraliomargarita sp. W4R53]
MRFSKKVTVGQVKFDVCTFDEAVDDLLSQAATGYSSGATRLSNAWCVVVADTNSEYAAQLNATGRTLPDGLPVAMIIKRQAGAQAQRVRGPSLFAEVLDRSQKDGITHFFLGSTEATLERLKAESMKLYPDLHIAGQWAPPFGPVDAPLLDEATRRVKESNADIVWVGLGTPKQDFAANLLFERTGLPCVAVGAAFDFVAGTVQEAPRWTQKVGLEWAFRLSREPRRLWRRYLIGNVQFLRIVARQPLPTEQ